MPDAPEDGQEVEDPGPSAVREPDLGHDLQESVESVADATDPTTDDPFIELDLVDSDRWAAPGGWPRAIVGVGVGLAAGWLLTVANRGDRTRARQGVDGAAGLSRPDRAADGDPDASVPAP